MIQITIDDKYVRAALRAVPELTAAEMSRELKAYVVNTSSDFSRNRLRAPDDRDPTSPTLHRPIASKGLRRATGGIAGAFYATSKVTSKFSEFGAKIGFLSGKHARIARVHELGTIKYGGSLPDIVPRRFKYLRIPVRGVKFVKGKPVITASRGDSVSYYVLMKKVGIPKRLGFIESFASEKKVEELTARMAKAARIALKKAVGRG